MSPLSDCAIDITASSNPDLGVLLLSVYIAISSILLLNLLIAVMNSSYSIIEKQQRAEWNRERCKIMVEQIQVFGYKSSKYAYYLVREDDYAEAQLQKTDAVETRLVDSIGKMMAAGIKDGNAALVEKLNAMSTPIKSDAVQPVSSTGGRDRGMSDAGFMKTTEGDYAALKAELASMKADNKGLHEKLDLIIRSLGKE